MLHVTWSKESKSHRYSAGRQQEKKSTLTIVNLAGPTCHKWQEHMKIQILSKSCLKCWASPHHGTLNPSNTVICNSCKSPSRRVKRKFQPPASLDMSDSEWPLIIFLAKSCVRTTQFILSIDQKSPSLGNTQVENEEMAQPAKCLLYRQKEWSGVQPHAPM